MTTLQPPGRGGGSSVLAYAFSDWSSLPFQPYARQDASVKYGEEQGFTIDK